MRNAPNYAMSTRKFILRTSFLFGLTLTSLLFIPGSNSSERFTCGHIKTFQDKMPKWLPISGASHCCRSGRLVYNLKSVDLLQRLYQAEHGRFALTLAELNEVYDAPFPISQPFSFQSNGTNWSLVVPRIDTLAGNYLLNASGKIFFHESQIPTTNDLLLTQVH
jgi:hypothetical protein